MLIEYGNTQNTLSTTWKRGEVIWSVSTARKGGEKKSERERMDWRGGCVSVWVRETARRRSVEWQRERELWHLSDLGCGEGSWLKHIPQAASDEKAAGQCGGEVATSFKSLRDHIGLPLTSSRLTHCSHRHLLSCVTHQPLNQLCCPVRSKGFPRLRHRDRKNKKNRLRKRNLNHWRGGKASLLLGKCTGFFWWLFQRVLDCLNHGVRKFLWIQPALPYVPACT